jgi:hypothetical protein
MIKLLDILENKILIPRRSPEEREKAKMALFNKKIKYIQNGGEGDLNLFEAPIQSLPDNLKIKGDLIITGTQIQILPKGLEVTGNIDASYTPLQSLPDGLKLNGYLNLKNTKIQSLPDDLEVKTELNIANTNINQLPKSIKPEYIDITGTPLLKNYFNKYKKSNLVINNIIKDYPNLKNTEIDFYL